MKPNTPKPKRGYKIVNRGKVKKGDFVKEVSKYSGITFTPWQTAYGLIGKTIIQLRNEFFGYWFACRKIK